MAARITAFILSFCIGFPMCWCCYGEVSRVEMAGCCPTEHPSGCSAQQTGSKPDHSENCPCCTFSQAPRDMVKTLPLVPAPMLDREAILPGWQTFEPKPLNELVCDSHAGLHEHGPPSPYRAPLYERYHALLL
ncbi:MAG: hypothetical protein IPK32_14130 [Verrucomicrobiaceae bacterium]|nr:hypothetical protein [Verrucomicrobiaceae bacterium]